MAFMLRGCPLPSDLRFLFFALATGGFAGMPSDVGFSQNSRFCCNVNALSERSSNRVLLHSSMRFMVSLTFFNLFFSVRASNVSSRALAALMISFLCLNARFKMYKIACACPLYRDSCGEKLNFQAVIKSAVSAASPTALGAP